MSSKRKKAAALWPRMPVTASLQTGHLFGLCKKIQSATKDFQSYLPPITIIFFW